MDKQSYPGCAKEYGFSDAALIKVEKIVFKPHYRKFCEENLCGFYGRNYACPPYCGSPKEMEQKVRKYENALVLQTTYEVDNSLDAAVMNPLKKKHTELTLSMIKEIRESGMQEGDDLAIMAGPCNTCETCKMIEGKPCPFEASRYSCLSAYCIDVTLLAKECGMNIRWDRHSASFFSIYLF